MRKFVGKLVRIDACAHIRGRSTERRLKIKWLERRALATSLELGTLKHLDNQRCKRHVDMRRLYQTQHRLNDMQA